MSETWSCEVLGASSKLTVGDSFFIHCQGHFPVHFKDSIQIQTLKKENKYHLTLLSVKKQTPQELILEVSSYHAGPTKDLSFKITDGNQEVFVQNLSFQFQSVLTKESKPFPPYGPFSDYEFVSFYLLFILSVLSILAAVFFHFNKYQDRKSFYFKIQDRLKGKRPFIVFMKNLRQLDLKKETDFFIKNLKKHFVEFLESTFYVDLSRFSVLQILKILKKENKKLYVEYQEDLDLWLKELEAFLKNPEKLQEQNKDQFVKNLRNLAYQIESSPFKKGGCL